MGLDILLSLICLLSLSSHRSVDVDDVAKIFLHINQQGDRYFAIPTNPTVPVFPDDRDWDLGILDNQRAEAAADGDDNERRHALLPRLRVYDEDGFPEPEPIAAMQRTRAAREETRAELMYDLYNKNLATPAPTIAQTIRRALDAAEEEIAAFGGPSDGIF